MATRRMPVSAQGTLAADTWRGAMDLLGLPTTARAWVVEGYIQVQDNGMVLRQQAEGSAAPTGTGDVGLEVAAGTTLGLGPVQDPLAGWPLHALYVRNLVAGNNATLLFTGILAMEC